MKGKNCHTDACNRESDYPFLKNGETKHACLECLPREHRASAITLIPKVFGTPLK